MPIDTLRSEAARLMGLKGGKNTLKKHGKGHFQRMAKLSWENRKSGDKSAFAKQAKAV